MQQTEMKNPCRYCADKKYWCRGTCIKKMAYKAARRELGHDNRNNQGGGTRWRIIF
jgi:hypothetical protein